MVSSTQVSLWHDNRILIPELLKEYYEARLSITHRPADLSAIQL